MLMRKEVVVHCFIMRIARIDASIARMMNEDERKQLHLLRRPSKDECDATESNENDCVSTIPGLYADWSAKLNVIYCKRKGNYLPRVCVNARIQVMYSNLCVCTEYPRANFHFPLVKICYIECKHNSLTVRGRKFDLVISYMDEETEKIEAMRNRLRFLVLRQRVPHSILGLPFEWQTLRDSHKEEQKQKKYFFVYLSGILRLDALRKTILDALFMF
ncbi:unnamed protein product [Anisakis simplex]|uniref:Phox homologous domain n=1 Tax=Anisakis simplex TaxID=6269 RepID=A0A0M3JTV4_ANISI|nr:unnamed protein product [Anisakis simplex]